MPQIIQQGAVNTNALIVPDLYVQIVPPQNLVLNGVPTNVVGVVGSATWGPVGQPAIIGTLTAYSQMFGPVQNRTYDMGTMVAIMTQQNAQNFRCVRVTDGTDVAATAIFNGTATANCSFVATSLYTGSAANGDTLTLAPAVASPVQSTVRASIRAPVGSTATSAFAARPCSAPLGMRRMLAFFPIATTSMKMSEGR